MSDRLKQSYVLRYHLEECESVYRDQDQGRDRLGKHYHGCPQFENVRNLVQDHYNRYPLSLGTLHESRMHLWVALVAANLDTVLRLSMRAGIATEPRLLTLDECVQLPLDVPEAFARSNMVRAVNTFSQRVLHTPRCAAVTDQHHPTLQSAVGVHVSGSRERTTKPYSNGSLTLSATDDPTRAMQYARFYCQVLPFGLWVDVRASEVVPTPWVLKHAGKAVLPLATNIATKHREYLPKQVTHFPTDAVTRITPFWFEGETVRTNTPFSAEVFREHWMHHPRDAFTSPSLVSALRQLLREKPPVPSAAASVVAASVVAVSAVTTERKRKRERDPTARTTECTSLRDPCARRCSRRFKRGGVGTGTGTGAECA